LTTGDLSQHPTDRLIREIIETRRRVTPREVEQIVDRIVEAPFNRRDRRVPPSECGVSYLGQTLAARVDSFTYHLFKRVVIEEQWAPGTTGDEYLQDLRRAAVDSEARVAV